MQNGGIWLLLALALYAPQMRRCFLKGDFQLPAQRTIIASGRLRMAHLLLEQHYSLGASAIRLCLLNGQNPDEGKHKKLYAIRVLIIRFH